MSHIMWEVKHRFPLEKELCSVYRAGRNIFLLSGWSEQLDNMDCHMDCNGQLTSILSEAVVWGVLFSLAFLQAESDISAFTSPACFHLCICSFRMTTELSIVKKSFLDGVLSSPFISRHLPKNSRTLNKTDKNKLKDIAVLKKEGGSAGWQSGWVCLFEQVASEVWFKNSHCVDVTDVHGEGVPEARDRSTESSGPLAGHVCLRDNYADGGWWSESLAGCVYVDGFSQVWRALKGKRWIL